MPVLGTTDDPAHNVTILDVAGKAIEWNGEDYVEAGTEGEVPARDSKDEERDSDQYLVTIIPRKLCQFLIPGIR